MPKIHSHYENLKVARNVPLEVIRAAYRTLSQKYHPDRNPGNDDAARIMAALNAAYETLTDSTKRREHDQWIAAVEADGGATQQQSSQKSTATRGQAFSIDETKLHQPPTPNRAALLKAGRFVAHILRNWFWYGLGAFILWSLANDKPSVPRPGPKPYQATPAVPAKPVYVRPSTAPNGQPWPSTAAYVQGYQRLHTKGLSTVTVDNSRNDSDVFVKLVTLDGAQAYPVRQFYIPAFGSFTLNKVAAGNYDIRYRDLDSGRLSRSEAFSLEEIPTNGGTQFSNMTMTLYKVEHGNMQTYDLSESEF